MIKYDVIILAGGKGRRLNKLTLKTPKPLLKIGKHPFLFYKIKNFLKYKNINKIFIATGYKSHLIKKFIELKFKKIKKIKIVDSGDVDIIQRIKHCTNNSSDNILVCYGDTLAGININDYVRYYQRNKAPLILTSDYKIEFGLLNVNNKSYVTKYLDGPKLKVSINLGYIFLNNKEIIKLRKCKKWSSYLKNLSNSKRLRSLKFNGKYITYNNEGELQTAEAKIEEIKKLIKI
jgi:mannose-1-phosphate guanylyltransferase